MAQATVSISESNGTTPTVTASITGTHMGTTDEVNMVAGTANAITAGSNSMEKWQRFNVSANGSSNTIKNLKVWASAALTGSDVHKTNCRESSYDGAQTYPTGAGEGPKTTDRSATYDYTQAMPTSEPTGANLGIGGSLTGEITSTGYSDYMIMQLQTNAATVAGKTITMYYQYDEYA